MHVRIDNINKDGQGVCSGAIMHVVVPRLGVDLTIELGAAYLKDQMYDIMTEIACAILENTKKWIAVKTCFPKPGMGRLPLHPCTVVFVDVQNMKGENYILFCETLVVVLEAYVQALRGGGVPMVEITGRTMEGTYYATHSNKEPPLSDSVVPRAIVTITKEGVGEIVRSFPSGYVPPPPEQEK